MISTRKSSVRTKLLWLLAGVPLLCPAQTGTPSARPTTAFNTTVMTAAGTVTSTSFVTFTTNTLALPVIPPSTTRKGECDLIFLVSSTSVTPTFALNTNATSTGLWVLGSQFRNATTTDVNFLPPTAAVTTATQTAFTAALTMPSAASWFQVHVDFALQTNTNPQQVTVYAKVNSGTLTVEPGSSCSWLP